MPRLKEQIRFGIVGLGGVGQEVARAALEDPRVTLVGIADVDPMKAGRDLGELIGEGRLGLPIDATVEAMLARARPEVAVVCSESDVELVAPTLEACLAHGAHVVTTCENLSDPEMGGGQLPEDFEARARAAGVVVLATGVNPGFAMDRLPVVLAQATRNIRRIRVARVVDAGTRRARLQQQVGVGLTPHGFAEAIRNGDVGHVGLAASLRLIARGLGITLDKTAEVFTPVLAASPTTSVLGAVPSGRVTGIHQIARGFRAHRELITLELTIALDEPTPRDTIDIVGEPPLHFEGELPGDPSTVAAVLSAVAAIVSMPSGLRTVLEVPLEQPEEPPPVDRSVVARDATQLPAPSQRMGPPTIEADDPDDPDQTGTEDISPIEDAWAWGSRGGTPSEAEAKAADAQRPAHGGVPSTPTEGPASSDRTNGPGARGSSAIPPSVPLLDAANEAPRRRAALPPAEGDPGTASLVAPVADARETEDSIEDTVDADLEAAARVEAAAQAEAGPAEAAEQAEPSDADPESGEDRKRSVKKTSTKKRTSKKSRSKKKRTGKKAAKKDD